MAFSIIILRWIIFKLDMQIIRLFHPIDYPVYKRLYYFKVIGLNGRPRPLELREKYLHNRIFPSLEELIEVLCQALSELTDDKERPRSMMFSLFSELSVSLQPGISLLLLIAFWR